MHVAMDLKLAWLLLLIYIDNVESQCKYVIFFFFFKFKDHSEIITEEMILRGHAQIWSNPKRQSNFRVKWFVFNLLNVLISILKTFKWCILCILCILRLLQFSRGFPHLSHIHREAKCGCISPLCLSKIGPKIKATFSFHKRIPPKTLKQLLYILICHCTSLSP